MKLFEKQWPWSDQVDADKYSYTSEWPKITIITPSFNQADFIEATILSVINQNYPNLEYIIVDGGSTDKSVNIISKYSEHLAYWISEKDSGTYDANNKALRRMTGEYWCVVNSDDYLLPNALLHVAEHIKKNPADNWLCGGELIIDENDAIISKRMPERPKAVEGFTFLNGCWISHPTVFLKRDVLDTVGLFRKTHMMDTDYWLNMEKAGFSPRILNFYIAAYRIHKDAKSVSKIKIQNEFLRIYTGFTKENNLERYKSVKEKLTDHIIELHQFQIWESLIIKDKRKALQLLLKILYNKPAALFSHWYLGLLKRLILGVLPHDPIIKHYNSFENQANWNI